jgi:hypothetical protein
MTESSDSLRKLAASYVELSKTAPDDKTRDEFISLAMFLHRLALDIERRTAKTETKAS